MCGCDPIKQAVREPWRDCNTMTELGDAPRPPITQWFRHLALFDDAPAVPTAT